MSKWKSAVIQCITCKEKIESGYPGEWICCTCFTSSHKLFDELVNTSQVEQYSKKYYRLADTTITGCYIDDNGSMLRTGGTFKWVIDDSEKFGNNDLGSTIDNE